MIGRRKTKKLEPDVELVRTLAKLLAETGLIEIEYEIDGHKVRVARMVTMQSTPIAAPSLPAEAIAPPVDPKNHPGAVKSLLVGVVYLASAPGVDPFVKVDDAVKKGDVLLIIEAMKVMNQIKAPRAGTVKAILVDDASPTEYDAVLMIIE